MGCTVPTCRCEQTRCHCCRGRHGIDGADGHAVENAAQIFSADTLNGAVPPATSTSSPSKASSIAGSVSTSNACKALLSDVGFLPHAVQAGGKNGEKSFHLDDIFPTALAGKSEKNRSGSQSPFKKGQDGSSPMTVVTGTSAASPRTQDQPSEEVADEVRQAGLTSDQLRGMMRQMVSSVPDSEEVNGMYEELDEEAKVMAKLRDSAGNSPRSPKASPVNIIGSLEQRVSAHLQVTIENSRGLSDCYSITDGMLGKGAYGEVRKAHARGTGLAVAVKSVSKNRAKRQLLRLRSELLITKQLDHPHVVKMCEVFEDDGFVHMVLELCLGGTLHSYVGKKPLLPESEAKHLMRQMISGVSYLHTCRVCHRDMKPGNVLLSGRSALDTNQLKISDYGLSCVYQPGVRLTAAVGTTDYMAPEVLRRDYDPACDLWSCGVVLFLVVCGYLPFRGKDKVTTRRRIVKGSMIYREEDWRRVTDSCLNVVRRLLKIVVEERFTAREVLDHSWIAIGNPLPEPCGKLRDAHHVMSCLRWFRKLNRFKRAAMHMAAAMLAEKQSRGPREAFMWLDVDHDGFVSLTDLRCRHGIHEGDADLFPEKDGQSDISYNEFVAATFDRPRYLDAVLCRAVFNTFDSNGEGRIFLRVLADRQGILGHLPPEEVDEMLDELSEYEPYGMDFEEFFSLMRKGSESVMKSNLTKSSLGLSDRSSVNLGSDEEVDLRRPPSRGASRNSFDSGAGGRRRLHHHGSTESIETRLSSGYRAGYATGRGKSQTRSGTTLLPVVDADSEKVHKFTSDNAKQIQAEVLKGSARRSILSKPMAFMKQITPTSRAQQ